MSNILEELDPMKKQAKELLARVVKEHGTGEIRPQQEKMVESIADAIESNSNLVVQAGTGVGKSLGYLIPAVVSGKRIVVSTATKQLSEQLAEKDVPFLAEVVRKSQGRAFTSAILKGRANYVCQRKVDEIERLDSLSEGVTPEKTQQLLFPVEVNEDASPSNNVSRAAARGAETSAVVSWSKEQNVDGDRSHGPVVSDDTWKTLSSTNAECPGKQVCPFGSTCFAERARNKAATVDVVITNHALVGTDIQDTEIPAWSTLGKRDLVIFDEVHELDNYLSNTWGCAVTGKAVEEVARFARRTVPASETRIRDLIEEISKSGEQLTEELKEHEQQLVTEDWDDQTSVALRTVILAATEIMQFLMQEKSENSLMTVALNSLTGLLQNVLMLIDESPETVRWYGDDNGHPALCAAPLRVGPKLMTSLAAKETTMVATSATITVGGSFEIPSRNLALSESGIPFKTIDVGTPFDYPKQAIMYVPSPDEFPAPVGKDRFEHTEAVLDFLVKVVKAAGGRTLALSTTSSGARRMAERLRDEVSTPVLSQFDAPAGVIAEQFAKEEQSTLCATMGMWHGLNVPGKSLSAVVIDKIPFAPMNDPLMTARTDDVNARGGNGFMDVYVAAANTMLAQGVGRLIRHTSDRGLVAVLDVRLKTKGYGRLMLKGLPDMWLTDNEDVALKSLSRLVSDSA